MYCGDDLNSTNGLDIDNVLEIPRNNDVTVIENCCRDVQAIIQTFLLKNSKINELCGKGDCVFCYVGNIEIFVMKMLEELFLLSKIFAIV